MVKNKQGNILACEEDIIVHQVNVQGIMRRRSSKAACKPISWLRRKLQKIL